MLEVHRASRTSPHRLLFFKLNHPSSFNIASEVFSNDLTSLLLPSEQFETSHIVAERTTAEEESEHLESRAVRQVI